MLDNERWGGEAHLNNHNSNEFCKTQAETHTWLADRLEELASHLRKA